MYHFLRPSNFIPSLLIGGLLTFQTFTLVHMYSTLLSDRAQLQAEVMHEYNVKFVNPRLSLRKVDKCVGTAELEYAEWKSAMYEEEARKAGRDPEREERGASMFSDGVGEENLDAMVRSSGRKARRPRESTTGRKFA